MRVVQLVQAKQYRGAEIFAAQLSRELIKSGVEVRYVALYKSTNVVFEPNDIPGVDLQTKHGALLNIQLIRKLKNYFTEFKPDVVQANTGDTLKYAVLVKMVFGFSYKIVYRNASSVSQYIRSAVQKKFNSFLYRRVEYIVSVSEKSKDDLLGLFPFCANKIHVIPVGIEARSVENLSLIKSENTNLIHVGGFTFEKNHQGLIKIFALIKEKIPNAKLWLVGDGPLKADIIKTVKDHTLEDAIIFTGAVSNTLEYIAAADVLLLPSILEGLPAVILEAFYCKTPVVAYDVGGIGEVVRHGETGLLITKGDESGFADAVVNLLGNESLEREITAAAHELVMREFDNKEIAKRFINVYQDLI